MWHVTDVKDISGVDGHKVATEQDIFSWAEWKTWITEPHPIHIWACQIDYSDWSHFLYRKRSTEMGDKLECMQWRTCSGRHFLVMPGVEGQVQMADSLVTQ